MGFTWSLSEKLFDKGLIGFDVAVVSSDRATGVAQTPKRGKQDTAILVSLSPPNFRR
tara:strand:- start:2791 stop:2961 length:171 start_codon:yes stop_codon:yes gene_type:complete